MTAPIARDTVKGRYLLPVQAAVAGNTATTDITVTGITPSNKLISVWGVDPDAVAQADVLKTFTGTITAADTIQTAEDSSAYTLLVTYA